MKAVIYNGPGDVSAGKVSYPKIEKPNDVVVRQTTTHICGSDLHMYEGRTSFEAGNVFRHENLGGIVEVGTAVETVKVGDRLCMRFNVASGIDGSPLVYKRGERLFARPRSRGPKTPRPSSR